MRPVEEFTEFVPGEAYSKGRPRFSGGQVYTPKGTRRFEELVGTVVGFRLRQRGEGPSSARFVVRIHLLRKATVKRDVDNMAKGILDALNGVAWVDDSQIVDLHVTEEWVPENPGIIINAHTIDHAPTRPAWAAEYLDSR